MNCMLLMSCVCVCVRAKTPRTEARNDAQRCSEKQAGPGAREYTEVHTYTYIHACISEAYRQQRRIVCTNSFVIFPGHRSFSAAEKSPREEIMKPERWPVPCVSVSLRPSALLAFSPSRLLPSLSTLSILPVPGFHSQQSQCSHCCPPWRLRALN